MITDTKTAREENPELEVFGNPDLWVLICKAEIKGKFMKSTKAMQLPGDLGCMIQVSTVIHGEGIAEAIDHVPGLNLEDLKKMYA